MKALDSTFRKYNETFSVTERTGDVVLLTRTSETGRETYEVAKLRKYPRYSMDGGNSYIEAHESLPPDEAWGEEGFTYLDKRQAEHKFLTMAENPYSPVQGVPTGEARGRKRSEFEVELPSLGSEFRIKDLHAKYPDQSVPFLHLRVKELMKQGRVEFVRSEKIVGQRGKPTSVFKVVSLQTVPALLK